MEFRTTFHAKRRSKQRRGVMSKSQLIKAAKLIFEGDPSCVFIKSDNDGRKTRWAIPYAGGYRAVVFMKDEGAGRILTVLPSHDLPLTLQRHNDEL